MDPLSIIASSAALVNASTTAIKALCMWIGEVKAIDDAINGFCAEIKTLIGILDSLTSTFRQPSMQEAAKAADKESDGKLWIQVATTMSDCEMTLWKLDFILSKLNSTKAGFFRRPVKQFKASLESGDIALPRQRIVMFNTALTLPLQMINLCSQARQRTWDTSHNNVINNKLDHLVNSVQGLEGRLQDRQVSYTSQPIFGNANLGKHDELKVYRNLQASVRVAKNFASNATARSISESGNASQRLDFGSEIGESLSPEVRLRIDNWLQEPAILDPLERLSELNSLNPERVTETSAAVPSPDVPQLTNVSSSQRWRTTLPLGQPKSDHDVLNSAAAGLMLHPPNEEPDRIPQSLSLSDQPLSNPPSNPRVIKFMRTNQEIERLIEGDNEEQAVKLGRRLLRQYTPRNALSPKQLAELDENVKNSDRGLSGSGYGYSPLVYLVDHSPNSEGEIKYLLDNGADIEATFAMVPNFSREKWGEINFSALHVAAWNGYASVVRLLLTHGAKVDALPLMAKRPLTELHCAAVSGHEDSVKVLLEAGANIEARSRPFFETALHLAANRGYVAVVALLLAKGADVEARGSLGGTPLHVAVVGGSDTTAMSLLLDAGAEINVKDSRGGTPLHWAARNGLDNFIRPLLDRGADQSVTSDAGETAMDLATLHEQRKEVFGLTISASNE